MHDAMHLTWHVCTLQGCPPDLHSFTSWLLPILKARLVKHTGRNLDKRCRMSSSVQWCHELRWGHNKSVSEAPEMRHKGKGEGVIHKP